MNRPKHPISRRTVLKTAGAIPLAQFRKRHRQPIVHKELYTEVFDRYENAYGPNLFSEYLPTDLNDAKAFLGDKSRWK